MMRLIYFDRYLFNAYFKAIAAETRINHSRIFHKIYMTIHFKNAEI